jgi:hypothetical protein
MAAARDIFLQRNEDFQEGWSLTRDDDTPIDLTECVLAGHVRAPLDNSTLVASFEIEITDAANGEATLKLAASEGSALAAYGNPIQVARLPYDIRLIYPDGSPLVLVVGTVVLSRGNTHT